MARPDLIRAVLVQLHGNNVTALLLTLVPGPVARNENDVLVRTGEHASGIKPHAERGRMWTQQAYGRGETPEQECPQPNSGSVKLP